MLKEVRKEVADLLIAAGIEAHHYEPERPSAPSVVVTAGPNYVTNGQTFTEYIMELELVVLVRGTNETMQDTLDDMIETVLAALPDWHLEAISESYIPIIQTNFIAARVTVTASVTL